MQKSIVLCPYITISMFTSGPQILTPRYNLRHAVMIEMFYDRGNHYEFRTIQQELAVPGELRNNANFDFEFKNIEKQYESYHGINVKLR